MIAFFLRRPIFAAVCSLIVFTAGLVAIPTLPISQYPKIAPPVITVSAQFLGADAASVEASVTTPLEEAINGVAGLRYITSSSNADGSVTITATFDLSKNIDLAEADVQNAVLSATGRLPAEVQRTGVVVQKSSSAFILGIGMVSENPRYDYGWLSNFTEINVLNAIKRVKGVGNVLVFGSRKYAMRLWLDPHKLAQNNLTAPDVVSALSAQNVQVAAGALGASPTSKDQPFQIGLSASGRLTSTGQFGDIVLRSNPDGGAVLVRDVGRVELGAEDYSTFTNWNGAVTIGMGVTQQPDANALESAKAVRARLDELAKTFPPGVHYVIPFDPTLFVTESIKEVTITLAVSIFLVVVVIFLFLQNWRMTLIPLMTIPISLVGTFALMKALGFSINTLTLFGLTLATGLVVDDAIVVIENIARFVQEKKYGAYDGAEAAMHEITGAVIATSLVLLAVFVPVAFFPGSTGLLYKQFALTIASSITISLFTALTLTPALSALLLSRPLTTPRILRPVERAIEAVRGLYRVVLPRIIAWRFLVLAVFAAALVLTVITFRTTTTGFIPDEDQGYLVAMIQTPEGTSIEGERRFADRIAALARANAPEIEGTFQIDGYNFFGPAPNHSLIFLPLKPWGERAGTAHTYASIIARLQPLFFFVPGGQAFIFNPPAIQGIGNFGGFQFEALDTANVGIPALTGSVYKMLGPANMDPSLAAVFTTFRADSPRLHLEVDRQKIQALHVPIDQVFGAMQGYFGSEYVNDFDYLNRSYRVYVQADAPFRSRPSDLAGVYVRSSDGGIVPLSNLVTATEVKAPPTITHYDLFRSIEIDGAPRPGVGSSDAIAAMEKVAKANLPPGTRFEWTGLTLDEIEGGSAAALIFGLGIFMVFLVLAAQYESFLDPLIILLAVPLAILGALWAVNLRHSPSDVFVQIGFVMLVGLASKNAILIVEFAKQRADVGATRWDAAIAACKLRLRPIIMTSFAFVIGVIPLLLA
ncbi:MAG: efflux RND transporter permease subunit, partial [Candidatus Eremiobacteraeota bacterium]|nr:efflux RND transporter permease subunit [Candidatus Eremiobacteraeota bacterium]